MLLVIGTMLPWHGLSIGFCIMCHFQWGGPQHFSPTLTVVVVLQIWSPLGGWVGSTPPPDAHAHGQRCLSCSTQLGWTVTAVSVPRRAGRLTAPKPPVHAREGATAVPVRAVSMRAGALGGAGGWLQAFGAEEKVQGKERGKWREANGRLQPQTAIHTGSPERKIGTHSKVCSCLAPKGANHMSPSPALWRGKWLPPSHNEERATTPKGIPAPSAVELAEGPGQENKGRAPQLPLHSTGESAFVDEIRVVSSGLGFAAGLVSSSQDGGP